MSTASRYFEYAQNKLQEVLEQEMPNIQKAADLITESCKNGGKFYVFGSGHSHMITEELYLRAGGLALVHGILPTELMLHQMSKKSSYMERIEGYGKALVELYKVDEKDTILVISNSGRNAVPVEMALEMKNRGVVTVCITNIAHSSQSSSRHASGKLLFEVCDIVIDNCGRIGDSAMDVGQYICAPTSTVIGAAILQAIVCSTVEEMLRRGASPEVFCSSNVDGGDAINQVYIDKYRKEIPML